MSFTSFNIDMPVCFSSGGHFISDGDWIHPSRTLESYLIIVGLYGEAYIYVQDTQYCVRTGDVLFLPANLPHGGFRISHDVSFFWFHFYPNRGQLAVTHYPDNTHPAFSEENAAHIPNFFSALSPDKLSILATQLLDVYESKYVNSNYQNYLMTLLLLEISQQYLQHINSLNDQTNHKLYSICEWIRVHSNETISLDNIANRFGYNKNYLCRLFKRHLNMTVQEYINHLKISHVKQYLVISNRSVKEIAYLTGFRDEKYMMRLFKSLEAITPTQFRRANNRTHMNRK